MAHQCVIIRPCAKVFISINCWQICNITHVFKYEINENMYHCHTHSPNSRIISAMEKPMEHHFAQSSTVINYSLQEFPYSYQTRSLILPPCLLIRVLPGLKPTTPLQCKIYLSTPQHGRIQQKLCQGFGLLTLDTQRYRISLYVDKSRY